MSVCLPVPQTLSDCPQTAYTSLSVCLPASQFRTDDMDMENLNRRSERPLRAKHDEKSGQTKIAPPPLCGNTGTAGSSSAATATSFSIQRVTVPNIFLTGIRTPVECATVSSRHSTIGGLVCVPIPALPRPSSCHPRPSCLLGDFARLPDGYRFPQRFTLKTKRYSAHPPQG